MAAAEALPHMIPEEDKAVGCVYPRLSNIRCGKFPVAAPLQLACYNPFDKAGCHEVVLRIVEEEKDQLHVYLSVAQCLMTSCLHSAVGLVTLEVWLAIIAMHQIYHQLYLLGTRHARSI